MDKRIIKTKASIRKAFMNTLAVKPYEKITVKEIAEVANVDRKTFYNYYTSIDKLLEEIEFELIGNFDSMINNLKFENIEDTLYAFNVFNQHLLEYIETYTLLMKIHDKCFLTGKTVDYFRKKIREAIEGSGVKPEKIDFAADYVAYGMLAVYRSWFNSDQSKPLEEITAGIAKTLLGGLPAYLAG